MAERGRALEIRKSNWKIILDEVKYWDALDLIRNFEVEMEKARNGLIHWFFSPIMNFPSLSGQLNSFILSPEIEETEDDIRISFPNLRGISREGIRVEINRNEFNVSIEINRDEGCKVIGWFRMHTPEGIDIETCTAELEGDFLRICLKRKTPLQKVKRIIEIKEPEIEKAP